MLTGTKDDESSSRKLLTAALACSALRAAHVCYWHFATSILDAEYVRARGEADIPDPRLSVR